MGPWGPPTPACLPRRQPQEGCGRKIEATVVCSSRPWGVREGALQQQFFPRILGVLLTLAVVQHPSYPLGHVATCSWIWTPVSSGPGPGSLPQADFSGKPPSLSLSPGSQPDPQRAGYFPLSRVVEASLCLSWTLKDVGEVEVTGRKQARNRVGGECKIGFP